MADKITLFFNLTPNNKNTFYVVSSKTTYNFNEGFALDMWGLNYANWLRNYNPQNVTPDKRYIELEPTTYNIYGDYIDIPLTSVQNNLQFAFITYMSIASNSVSGGAQKFLFYYVNSFTLLNNRVRLFVTPDYWGTYCGYAKFEDVTITKTNAILSLQTAYRREEIPLINEAFQTFIEVPFTTKLGGTKERISRADLRIYAVIEYEDPPFTNKSTHVELFQFNPADYQTPVTETTIYDTLNMIAGIYRVTSNTPVEIKYEAKVVKLYLYDKNLGLTTKTQSFVSRDNVTITGTRVAWYPQQFKIYIQHGNVPSPVPDYTVSVATDFYTTIAFGTKYNSIKLPPFVGSYAVRFEVHPYDDKIVFLICAGTEELDISTEFEIGVVANSNTVPIENLGRILQVIGSGASSIFQIQAGGAGIISGTAQLASIAEPLKNIGKNEYRIIPSGNGYATWRDVLLNNVGSALVVIANGSLTDMTEKEYEKRGLECYYMPTLTEHNNKLFAYYMLQTRISDEYDYYIRANTRVYGIPSVAQDEISEALAEGMYIVYFE